VAANVRPPFAEWKTATIDRSEPGLAPSTRAYAWEPSSDTCTEVGCSPPPIDSSVVVQDVPPSSLTAIAGRPEPCSTPPTHQAPSAAGRDATQRT
jgi:hypothetical protein